MLDPLTAAVLATIYSLLCGAVLGFMHDALPNDLQPSATDWRIGTLLLSCGGILFVAQSLPNVSWVIPISNGCWMFGLALYWRAVRRYFGERDSFWIFAPAVAGFTLITIFALVYPSLAWRLNVATLSWVTLLAGSAWTLMRNRGRENSVSRKVLSWIFITLAISLLARGIYYLTQSTHVPSISTPVNIVNILTPVLIGVLPIMGTTVFVLLCFERIRRVLQRIATIDSLTGLPNRRMIGEHGATLFARAKNLHLGFSIAVIDVDHFKKINDQYGHDIGDLVLKGIADTLAAHCRQGDVVGRHGGEEFVALFKDADATDALAAAERLRIAIEATTHPCAGAVLSVTISAGVAAFSAADDEYADILRRADRALYAAKAAGRNCTQSESTDNRCAPNMLAV